MVAMEIPMVIISTATYFDLGYLQPYKVTAYMYHNNQPGVYNLWTH